MFPERDIDSLKRKYKFVLFKFTIVTVGDYAILSHHLRALLKDGRPTGSHECPPLVRIAKGIDRLFKALTDDIRAVHYDWGL
jgi:hypothetical protein